MSKSEPWYAGFDVIDFESTPMSEWPEDDGFHLICPIDGCDHEAKFDYLGEVGESDWTQMGMKDQILTDGTTLKEGYCPSHSASESDSSEHSGTLGQIQSNLGKPLDGNETSGTPEYKKNKYDKYDFASGITSGYLMRCDCDSCDREESFDGITQIEESEWKKGLMVNRLEDGRTLKNGRCPEHHTYGGDE
jgi:hypothetical protein